MDTEAVGKDTPVEEYRKVWNHLLLFLMINLLVLFLFLIFPKRRSTFEIFGCWLVTMIFNEDWLTISSVNMHLIGTKRHTLTALVILLNRLLEMPILSNLFLELYLRFHSAWQKALTFVLFVATLTFSQYANEWVNLYHHENWHWWWSIAVWSSEALLLLGTQYVFKRLVEVMQK